MTNANVEKKKKKKTPKNESYTELTITQNEISIGE